MSFPQMLFKPSIVGSVKVGETLCDTLIVADEEEMKAAKDYQTADEILGTAKPAPKRRTRKTKAKDDAE